MRLALALLPFLLAAPASAKNLLCDWKEKHQCAPDTGCKSLEANKMFATVNLDVREYQRCDARGCDKYPAMVTRSGVYTIIDLPGRGVFVKIGPQNVSTEVVSLGNTVLVSQGVCR